MKILLTLTIAALLFGFRQTAHSQFILKADKEIVNINAGESTAFSINFTIENNFDASIFLTVKTGTLQMQNGGGSLSSYLVYAPYNGIVLTITTMANFTKGGIYEFYVTGTNGSLSSTVLCKVNVSATPRSNWRLMPRGTDGIPQFIIQDTEENYWRNYKGIQKEYSNTPLEQWMSNSSLNFGYSTNKPIIDIKNNKIWIPTDQGLVRYTLNKQNKTVYLDPLPSISITTLAVDTSSSTLWVGTLNGLARLVGTEWTVFDTSNSVLGQEQITSIVVSNSIVWIGTLKGLIKFDGKDWKRFTPQNSSIPAQVVRVMAVESNGEVWMGLSNYPTASYSGENRTMIGLAKFDGANWSLYNSQNSPIHPSNYVNAIALDKKGNKWVATASHRIGDDTIIGGAGILKFDNTEWTAYTKANSPLPGNKINWLGVDNNDNVWFHAMDGYSNIISDNFWGVFNENGLPPFLAPPTGVEEQPEPTDGITIYPNPTNTTFTISGADNILSVKIMNSLGMEVSRKSSVVSGKVDVDVADLASGVYFVQLRTPTGMITKSIIVSR